MLATLLVVVPASPASAIQTIAWTTPPPSTATLGTTVSFAWSGTANTFLGARITGCFANFPDGGNYANSFQGNFTTGNCNYQNRTVTTSPTYPITVGFNLSNGGSMTMSWNISVAAPTPTVITSGNVTTTATSVNGAPATFSAYGYDAYYGTYGATCAPASGSTFAVGTTNVTCSATNAGGKTGSASLQVVVQKATPTMSWNPPASVPFGATYGSLMSASMVPADATGTITYSDGVNQLAPGAVPPVGAQTIYATYSPSGAAANAYNAVTIARSITVIAVAQSVAFTSAPTNKTFGDAPFTVSAAGTSGGGAVTITAQTGSACTVSQLTSGTAVDATVTLTGAAPCVLLANQAASGSYTAAPTVQRSVTVAKATPVVTFPTPSTMTYGTNLSSALQASANVPGTFGYTLNGVPVTAGSVPNAVTAASLVATFTPSNPNDYTSAVASVSLDVIRAPQTLAVTPLADHTYGDAPIAVSASASGGGITTITATGPCIVQGSTVAIRGTGDCTVTTVAAGTANFLPTAANTQTFSIAQATPTITWSDPAPLVYGTPLDDGQLNAALSAPVADPAAVGPIGALEYSSPAGDVLPAGDHVLRVTWTPFDETSPWQATSAEVTIHVDRAMPTISWDTPSAITYGTPLTTEQLNATADVDVTFEYLPAAGEVLGAGDHFLVATFTPADTDNYMSGTQAVALTVDKAPQTIDFAIAGTHTYGDAPFALTATGGGSGNPVTFSVEGGSACTVAGSTLTITGAGACVIAATQAGNDDFLAAAPVTSSATVERAVPTITWDPPAGITYGTPLGGDQLDATVDQADASGTVRYFLAGGVLPADGVVLHAGDGQQLVAIFEPDGDSVANYLPATATVTIDVARAPQAITFDPLAGRTYGDAPFAIGATGGGSGLPVTFTATGAACDVSGTTVQIVAAGQCFISAAQAGDADHLAAPPVEQVLTVAQASQTLAIGAIAGHTFGDAPFTVDVTPGASGAPVLLSATGSCAVTGELVSILHAGSCTITAAQGGGPNHLPATPASTTFAIGRAGQAIAFAPITPTDTATFFDAPVDVAVTGGASGEPVVLTADGGACEVAGTTITIVHAGECAVTASQAGTADYAAAADVTRTLTVAKYQPVITWSPSGLTYGDPIGAAQLNATSSPGVAGSITYTVADGDVLDAGTYDLTATFTPDDGDDVAGVSTTVAVVVDRAAQTITFDPIGDHTYGDAPFAAHAVGGASGEAVTFSSGTDVCSTTTDGTVSVDGAGECAISADQAGTTNYDAAATVTQHFGVGKATPDVTWDAPTAITFGTALDAAQLGAEADVDGTFTYTPAAGTVLHASTTPQTLTVRFDPADTERYVPVEVTTSVVVDRAPQTIGLPAIGAHTFGDAPFTVSVSPGPSSSPAVLGTSGDCTVAGTRITITGAGACTVTADQAGDADFLAAPSASTTFAIAKGAGAVSLAAIGDRTFGDVPFAVAVTASPLGGAVTLAAVGGCAVSASGQVAITAAGSCTITAAQAEGPNVLAATASRSFTIAKAPQVLAFAALADRTYGDAPFALTATPGGSGNPVTFTATGAACTVSGSTVTVVAAGTCSITANEAAGPNHLAATPVSRTVVVKPAALTVTPADATRPFGQANPTFAYALTGFVRGDAASVVTTPPACTTTATLTSPAGRYPITCSGGAATSYTFTYKTATLTVGLTPTRLAITTPATAVAGPTVVTATLTDALTGAPVTGASVLLSADLSVKSATTNPASATFTLKSGVHVLGALYLGDANHLPAIDAQLLVSYQPTRFVIWGGNQGGVQAGRSYTFYGSQWHKQVTAGSYGASGSFKGFAQTLNAAGTSWTATTGSATGMPAELGDVISVLVSTSITKSGSAIAGNVTRTVLLAVDDARDYRPNGNGDLEGVLLTSL